jgi:UDP:flavonoid glycosyltransferase YjiC (YdhE family)
VPLFTVPVFADQFENGRRVAGAGAGLHVVPPTSDAAGHRRPVDDGDAGLIADAVGAVLGDGRFRRRAAEIAAEMATARPTDDLLSDLAASGTDALG